MRCLDVSHEISRASWDVIPSYNCLLISSLTYGTLKSRIIDDVHGALMIILRYLFWNLCNISIF